MSRERSDLHSSLLDCYDLVMESKEARRQEKVKVLVLVEHGRIVEAITDERALEVYVLDVAGAGERRWEPVRTTVCSFYHPTFGEPFTFEKLREEAPQKRF